MKKEQLKKWRKEVGMTQAQFAELIGYERWAVMKWEQGVVRIPKWVWMITGLITEEHLRGINETARKALSNRGDVSKGKAVSRHRQKARSKGVRVKKLSD